MDTYYNLPDNKKRELYLKVEPNLTISDFQIVEKNLQDLSTKYSELKVEFEGLKQYLITDNIKVPDSITN